MPLFATEPSVRRAGRLIKRIMNFIPEGWTETRERARGGERRGRAEILNMRTDPGKPPGPLFKLLDLQD